MNTSSQLTGANLVAGEEVVGDGAPYTGSDPRTGKPLDVEFRDADGEMIDRAAEAAADAAAELAQDRQRRVDLLRRIASTLVRRRKDITSICDAETALGDARLDAELDRTVFQLEYLADIIEDGGYLDATIDLADPDYPPGPRPDVRKILRPLGPVAVFGAGNFPLAFSVAGVDTAAALAAGCPVIAKAHPSHPGTSELVGRCIATAAEDTGLPSGMFSLVHGRDPDVGRRLVTSPYVRAIGFTGSLRAGRALFDAASGRPDPIPVYAEMGSVNPVVVAPEKARTEPAAVAAGFVASMTSSCGQYCTKPGILFVPEDGHEPLLGALGDELADLTPGFLLNEDIATSLKERAAEAAESADSLARLSAPSDGYRHDYLLLVTDVETFLADEVLREELFGPVAVVVRYTDRDELLEALAAVPPSLAAALHMSNEDKDWSRPIQRLLEERSGRLIWNGFPTGVSVTDAMHHGGPYPATTFPLFGSVGRDAIRRFLMPIAYQDAPREALPQELRDEDPGIPRRINGVVVQQELRQSEL